MAYRWRAGANFGGGYGQVGAIDGDTAVLVGDMWGAGRSEDGGKLWRATNEGAPTIPSGRAIALSKRPATQGWAFFGNGVSHNSTPGSGYFGVLSPEGKIQMVDREYGFSLNIDKANATVPRPAGQTIDSYYDAGVDREYIYTATPLGISRYHNDGARSLESSNLAPVRLSNMAQCWKAIVCVGDDQLLLATYTKTVDGVGQAPKVYLANGVRTTQQPTITEIRYPGVPVNALRWISGRLYAACAENVYRIDQPGRRRRQTWVNLGGSFFTPAPRTSTVVLDIAGHDDTLFAGLGSGNDTLPPGHAIAKSTDAGQSWQWAAGNVSKTLYGTSDVWWLSTLYPDGGIQGKRMDVNQLVYGNGVLLAFGRRGVWASDDEAQSWAPAVNGIGGSVVNNIKVDRGTINAADVDWDASVSQDRFTTCVRGKPVTYGPKSLTRNVGGHTYRVVEGTPCDITRDGESIADDAFRGWATKGNVEDLQVDDAGVVYVGSSGGGVYVGEPV